MNKKLNILSAILQAPPEDYDQGETDDGDSGE